MSQDLKVDDQNYVDLANEFQRIGAQIEPILDEYVSLLQDASQYAFKDGLVSRNLSSLATTIVNARSQGGGQGSISDYLNRLEEQLKGFPATIDQQDQFLY
jgi:hypothetical protein